MKKLVTTVNRKGLTIIELIVSIALISIIMLFLLNLLSDLKHEDSYSDYAKENQVNRAQIIKTIEERLIGLEQTDYMTRITASYNKNEKLATIQFTFKSSKTITLEIKSDYLNYIDSNSELSEQYNIEKKQEESRFYPEGIELIVNKNEVTKLGNLTSAFDANINDTSLCETIKNIKLNSNLGNASLDTYNPESGSGKTNNNLVACPKYIFFELKIPIITDADDNPDDSKAIDDIVLSFIGKKIQ